MRGLFFGAGGPILKSWSAGGGGEKKGEREKEERKRKKGEGGEKGRKRGSLQFIT